MSNRPGICLSSQQHREILLNLEAEEIQRLYQDKFAEMIKDSNPQTADVGKKSFITSTLSEPGFASPKPIPIPSRSLTAPQLYNDLEVQSVYSGTGTLPSSSPGSSRNEKNRKSLAVKKSSLPAKFAFTPMMDEAMSIAAEQLGDQVNVDSVSFVGVNAEKPMVKKKMSLFGGNKRKVSEPPMEVRFKFNSIKKDQVLEETEDEREIEETNALPTFSVTVTDPDQEDMCPIDMEGFEFGEGYAGTQTDDAKNKPSLPLNGDASKAFLRVDQGFDTKSLLSMKSSISLGSQRPVQEYQQQLRTEEDLNTERRERFWDSFVTVFSFMYGIALVMIAMIIYVFDHFGKYSKASLSVAGDGFNMFLCIIGIAVILFLLLDINKYLTMMKDYYDNQADNGQRIKLVETEDGQLIISMPLITNSEPSTKIPQYYCFSTGRHSGSLFLKIGAIFFCVGHIIHMIVLIMKQALFFQFDHEARNAAKLKETKYDEDWNCGQPVSVVYCLLQALYVFLQLYMIFKYSNVIVNRSKKLARIAFIHCLASSLCFWIYTIFHETVDYIAEDMLGKDDAIQHPRNVCKANSTFKMEMDCFYAITARCIKMDKENGSSVETIFNNVIPYLYPFSIEFSIMVAGIWYIMWDNIGKVAEHRGSMEFLPDPMGSIADSEASKVVHDSLLVFADCHASIKGIFLGLILFILSFTGIIAFSVLEEGNINDSIESVILCIMIMASIWVYISIYQLDVNPNPISFLDDLLLFVCLPSFFVYGILSFIAGYGKDPGSATANCFKLIQVLIQTPMIVDGLRRCSDSRANQTRKPGRNVLTFLIIANLTLYLWETMENKTSSLAKNRKEYYGKEFWIIASHATLPLCIFYRFHSAVALADIWSSAYQAGSHH